MVGYRAPEVRKDLTVEGDRVVVHGWRPREPTGRVALLLHGLMSDHRELGALPSRLAEAGFETWAIDFRGCGASEGRRALQTLDRMLVDVAALGEATTRAPDLVLGHSLGAAVAIHASAEGILRPARLVVASPPDRTHGAVARASFALAGLPGVRSFVLPLPRRYGLTIRKATARAWAEAENFKERRMPLATWAAMGSLDTAAAARRVDAPTLVVVAKEDRIVPVVMSLRVAANLRDSEVLEVDGYHSVFLCEDAERAVTRVAEFARAGGSS